MRKIDKDWFVDQLRKRGQSQRRLAAFMGAEPATITHIFNGKREPRFGEIEQIASFLRQPIPEVTRRFGLPVGDIKPHKPNGGGDMMAELRAVLDRHGVDSAAVVIWIK